MIEPISRKDLTGSVSKAKIVCDCCGVEEIAGCDYQRKPDGSWEPREAQILKKVNSIGWAVVKGKHLCPSCKNERKRTPQPKEQEMAAKKPEPTANVKELRQPTREQKREIMALIGDAYDEAKGRYAGGETDATIADVIGGGCMPGWVAEIREEFFGPDGGNDDMEDLAEEIRDRLSRADEQHKTVSDAVRSMLEIQRATSTTKDELQAMLDRVEAIKRAVGPRAKHVG